MEQREEHDRLADELDEEADKLQRQNAELGEEIKQARSDWETKRRDPAVPGAPEPPERDS